MAVPPCWTKVGSTLCITNPGPGMFMVMTGFTWNELGTFVSAIVDSLNVTCSPSGAAPHTPASLKVALTKTGNYVPATTFHSFPLTADSVTRNLANIDFSSELIVSPMEAGSGLVGILFDFSDTFVGCQVCIAVNASIQLCWATGGGAGVAAGMGYGNLDESDEFLSVVSGQVFTVDGDYVPEASAYHWSSNLITGTSLNNGPWKIWQFNGDEYLTDASGTFKRPVSVTFDEQFVPLYQDYLNPGSNGAGTAAVFDPPYPSHPFISGSDTATTVSSSGNFVVGTASIDATNNCLIVPAHGGDWTNSNFGIVETTLAATADLRSTTSGPQGVPCKTPYLILHWKTTKTAHGGDGTGTDLSSLGFGSDLTRWTVNFSDGTDWTTAHATQAVQCKVLMRVNPQQQTDIYAWFDLQPLLSDPIAGAFLATVKKIRFGLGMRGGAGGGVDQFFRLHEFILGAQYYHLNQPGRTIEGLPFATPLADGALEYAFNYTEAGASALAQNAHTMTVPAGPSGASNLVGGHLGTQLDSTIPYSGSWVAILIPTAPVPFTASAKINVYRKEGGGVWQRISQQANTGPLSFTDVFTDHDIRADLVTFPVTTLTFGAVDASASGQVTGVLNGCSFGGCNVYFRNDGFAYFSQSGDGRVVLWPGVTVGNLSTLASTQVPRTVQIADDLSPVLIGVANEPCLYMFTRREGWVMVMQPGQTPATMGFPTRIDGARGALGVNSASRHLQGAVVGADDGLWYVVKWDATTSVPDVNEEITKENRGLWAQLIGTDSDPETLVVRQLRGDVWCFCQSRFMHFNKDGFVVYGEWMDGGIVTDAYGEPSRGMVVQFSDGSLAVTGQFLTDRGTNLAGDNGAVTNPAWTRRTKRFTRPANIDKIRVVYENSSDGRSTPNVVVKAFSQRGSPAGDGTTFNDSANLHGTKPPDKGIVFPGKIGGQWWEFELSGSNYDLVTSFVVEVSPTSAEPKAH